MTVFQGNGRRDFGIRALVISLRKQADAVGVHGQVRRIHNDIPLLRKRAVPLGNKLRNKAAV